VLIFDTATDMLNYPGIRVNSHTQVQGIAVQPMNTPVSTTPPITSFTVRPHYQRDSGHSYFRECLRSGLYDRHYEHDRAAPTYGLQLRHTATYYNIATTAMFSRATVCITASTPIPPVLYCGTTLVRPECRRT